MTQHLAATYDPAAPTGVRLLVDDVELPTPAASVTAAIHAAVQGRVVTHRGQASDREYRLWAFADVT